MRVDHETPFVLPGSPRRRSASPVTIECGKRSAWLRGKALAHLIDETGAPRMWCPREKCLTIPIDRVDDLLALLEHRDRRPVHITVVDR